MWDKVNEPNTLRPLDDYTVMVGECVITRETVAPSLSNHWVGASIHICDQHNLWVIWPVHQRQINFTQGPQAHISGGMDQNETLGLIP